MTKLSFEEILIEVWRQALVENVKAVRASGERYPVSRTPKRGLRQVDFVFDGNEIRGLEQNPETKSRWAQLARSGKKVMQFLSEGRYVANVVDRKVTLRQSTVITPTSTRPQANSHLLASTVICAGASAITSGTPRYSAIFPVTQIRFSLYSTSGLPNLLRLLPQITTVNI